MTKAQRRLERVPTLRELYPTLSEEELKEADINLQRYLEVCLRIYERLLADPEAYARFEALTQPPWPPTMEGRKVDSL